MKKENGDSKRVKRKGKTFHVHVDDELKQVFVGHHTLFSVLGFTIGGILMGEMLARFMFESYGMIVTAVLGFLIFIVSAFWSQEFRG